MKKIKNVNQKDRVICVTVSGGHEFYYQPVNSRERIWLFETKDFSGSIFAYFRDKGRNIIDGRGFSLTIKELYDFKKFQNFRLCKLFTDRIPQMVEYVIKEQRKPKETNKYNIAVHERVVCHSDHEDREIAA